MSELFKAMKEQARHISSLGSGLGKTDAIQSMDELIDMVEQENAELQKAYTRHEEELAEAGEKRVAVMDENAELKRDVQERHDATQENYEVILKLREQVKGLERIIAESQKQVSPHHWECGEDNDGWYVGPPGEQRAWAASEEDALMITFCMNSSIEIKRRAIEEAIVAIEESQPPATTPWNCVDAIRKKCKVSNFASPVIQEGMQLVGEKSENGIEWQFANTVHDMPVGTKLYAMLNASKDG